MKTPQLIKERVLNEFNLNDGVAIDNFDVATKSQIQNATDTIKRFENLQNFINRHEESFKQFISHLIEIIINFEHILNDNGDIANQFSDLIKPIQSGTNSIIETFDIKIKPYLANSLKSFKNFQKILKDISFLELDLKRYSNENKKLKEKQQLQDKEYKKLFENERKIEEIREKHNNTNKILKLELPSFLLLTNKIIESMSVIIYYYIYDLYRSLYDVFILVKPKIRQSDDLSNIYFKRYLQETKKKQKDICEKIESFKMFSKYSTIYNLDISANGGNGINNISEIVKTTPDMRKIDSVKRGRALYSFKGEESSDLVFSKGDEVIVLKEHPNGWWEGKLVQNGAVGTFPYNYFKFAEKS